MKRCWSPMRLLSLLKRLCILTAVVFLFYKVVWPRKPVSGINMIPYCHIPQDPYGKSGYDVQYEKKLVCNHIEDVKLIDILQFNSTMTGCWLSLTSLGHRLNAKCTYRNAERLDDFFVNLSETKTLESKLEHEAVAVHCTYANGGGSIDDIVPLVLRKESIERHPSESSPNIMIFGFDSLSRFKWKRYLPETYQYMINHRRGVEMEGYSIVGDGTTPALLAILTGFSEEELHESRRGYQGAEQIDDFPWIWKLLHTKGYVTQWGEDGYGIGTFQYRLLGFKNPPVTHYLRPFYGLIESPRQSESIREKLCLFGKSRFQIMLDHYRQLRSAYPNTPLFSLLFHSQYTHDDYSLLPDADRPLLKLLQEIDDDNTVLILISDHGTRFGYVRQTQAGKIDERSPMLYIRLPQSVIDENPKILSHLKANADKLTTPFDLHATLIGLSGGSAVKLRRSNAFSLVSDMVDRNRTCRDASIPDHFCLCQERKPLPDATELIPVMENHLRHSLTGWPCKTRRVLEIMDSAAMHLPTQTVAFQQSDKHGRNPEFTSMVSTRPTHFELTVKMTPDDAVFQFSVSPDRVRVVGISRLNAYSNSSWCVRQKPSLLPMCFCEHSR